MAKVYDPIMCMMVDKPDKAQDAANGWKVTVEQNLKKYEVLSSAMSASGAKLEAQNKYPNGTVLKVERATVKDANKYVEQAIKWMKEGKGRLEIIAGLNQMGLTPSDVASYYAEAMLATGYKAKDSASAIDEAIKTADGATGDKLYADVKAIYSLFSNILLTYTNEQSVQKLANEGTKKCLELAAKVKGVRDEAIKACDASYEYEGTYRGAKIQITVPDEDGTRNVYLDGRALWQDEGSVNKVLSAVKQLIDRQKK